MGIVDFTNYDDMKYAVSVESKLCVLLLQSSMSLKIAVHWFCSFYLLSNIIHLVCVQIRKLDDSEFRNPFSRSFIRVKEDKGYGSRRSASRSRSRSRRLWFLLAIEFPFCEGNNIKRDLVV